jgi:hypothetical protein
LGSAHDGAACGGAARRAQAARAMGNIAMNEVYEELIVTSCGVQALVSLLDPAATGPEQPHMLDAALGALGNLIECTPALRPEPPTRREQSRPEAPALTVAARAARAAPRLAEPRGD